MHTIHLSDLLRVVAGLMSDGENPEYDRACVEIACDLLPVDGEDDTKAGVEALLRAMK